MTPSIHAAWSPGEVRVAAAADGVLLDYAIWRPGAPDGVGDICLGRVTAIVPAMAGAFVAIDGAEGFLPDSEGAKGLTEGAVLLVRVTRAALGGKGPRLSARVEGSEPRAGADPLRELAARYPEASVLTDDPGLAASLRGDLGPRVVRVPRAFDDGIETAVEALAAPEATLASGVRLSIWPTPALVAIDVDAGGTVAGRNWRHKEMNAVILPDLARQIRLRNLSGAILVDLAGMKARQRAAFGPALAATLAGDPLRPRLLGFTALGLAEIVRPRVRAPLHEVLQGPLPAGLAALRAMAQAIHAKPGQRLALRAAPAVVAALQADPVALGDFARIAGRGLQLRSDPSLTGDSWRMEALHG